MAENRPQLPPGFQRPGIPGAGNILDPAVRGELREKLHGAVHGAQPAGAPQPPGAVPQPAAASQEPSTDEATTPAATAEAGSAPTAHRVGPFPHGDVDLRGFAANVPPGPVRPRRGRGGRHFYFLGNDQQPADAPAKPAATQPPDVRKPG